MTRRRVTIVGVGVAVLVLVAAAVAVLLRPAGDEPEGPLPERLPPTLTVEEGVLVYAFHLPSGSHSLFDNAADPDHLRNLIDTRPEDAERLRAVLRARHGVADLEGLRAEHRELIDELRRLGYF